MDAVPPAEDHPSYGLALVAVLAAGAVASAASVLFIGFIAVGGASVRYLIGALLGGLAVQIILRVLGFRISYGGAFVAMVLGVLAAIALRNVLPFSAGLPALVPFVSSLAGLPSLLLTAWLVQMSAARPRRELPV